MTSPLLPPRVQRAFATLGYALGGVVRFVSLFLVWEHLWGRVLAITAIMVVGLGTWASSWRRMPIERADRRRR